MSAARLASIQHEEDERVQNEPTWHEQELAASRVAPITAPRVVADLLLELATDSGSGRAN
jgi:hypothetical protein